MTYSANTKTILQSKAKAQLELAAILNPINGRRNLLSEKATMGEFVTQVYLSFYRRKWKESTAGTNESRLRFHVLSEFSGRFLGSFTRNELQDFLDRKAPSHSSSVVAHLRWFLSGIFKLAVSDGLVMSNPAAELRIPKRCKDGWDLRPLTKEEVNSYLNVFDLREQLIARLAIFEGMRPGEIFALRWKSIQGDAVRVEQRVYKRVLDTPKNGKTREGAISDGTLKLLKEWRDLAQDQSPEEFVFPSH